MAQVITDGLFRKCRSIAEQLNAGKEAAARNALILVLNELAASNAEYPELVTHLIRQVGLYPYMRKGRATWQDALVLELFAQDIGGEQPVVLHREQSRVLKSLLDGKSLALSAPTSFGKSFIIDAFINDMKPDTVVIIVPTIALMDETRRRIYKKFSNEYKIITTIGSTSGKKSIFIFPQERALSYIEQLDRIDLFVVDEFYKASPDFDRERSHALIQSILVLGSKAKQRYFLAPNISNLPDNALTKGMVFERIEFNTVVTNIVNKYSKSLDDAQRFDITRDVIKQPTSKTLIYAGTYKNIGIISEFILKHIDQKRNRLLDAFAKWLKVNYGEEYQLSELVKRETGIHNGRLHRSLSQLQIRLFEDANGLKNIISTSSVIEGVNTSAENIVIWSSKNGKVNIDNFTYKNIAGRGGRMFKHFVGNVYMLDKMPPDEQTSLVLSVDETDLLNLPAEIVEEQRDASNSSGIDDYHSDMRNIVGKKEYDVLIENGALLHSNSGLVRTIAHDIKANPAKWASLKLLNSMDESKWDSGLYLGINYAGVIGAKYSVFVEFVKTISKSWTKSLPELLKELQYIDLNVSIYFELERNATYKLVSSLSIINTLVKSIRPDLKIDISPFIARLSCAFLPANVFHLEEFGLPRSLARKIHDSRIYDFENDERTIDQAVKKLADIGKEGVTSRLKNMLPFEEYILTYFYEGI